MIGQPSSIDSDKEHWMISVKEGRKAGRKEGMAEGRKAGRREGRNMQSDGQIDV